MGAIAEVCFAMNLHTAVDVLCLHRILLDWGLDMHLLYFTCAFIGRQHLLHFVFFLHPVLQFQTFAGLLTRTMPTEYCSCEDLPMTLSGEVTAELPTGFCVVLHQ